MNLTRADVENIIECGDVVCVVYREANGVSRLLRFWEGGRSSHSIECLGGMDTVEETIGGGMRTNLFTYLRGNTDLKIRRSRTPLNQREKEIVKSYWLSLVAKGYGWDSIKRSLVTIPIRRFVKPVAPLLADWLLGIARFLLPGKMPDCSAAWVCGMRLVRPTILHDYEPEEVDPHVLDWDPNLVTVAYWPKPILVEGE